MHKITVIGFSIWSFLSFSTLALAQEADLIEKKLRGFVIDEIQFNQAPFGEVISSLVDISRILDPEDIGVNIIFKDPKSQRKDGEIADPDSLPTLGVIPPITLKLRNVTLLDLLTVVTEISGLTYRIERNLVVIDRKRMDDVQQEAIEKPKTTAPGINPLEKKLKGIVIDEIDFHQAPLSEVIASLVDFSRKLAPDGVGVSIIFLDPFGGVAGNNTVPGEDPFGFGAPAGGSNPSSTPEGIPLITLKLRNVTLLDALKIVTEKSGLTYRVERNLIIIERERLSKKPSRDILPGKG